MYKPSFLLKYSKPELTIDDGNEYNARTIILYIKSENCILTIALTIEPLTSET